MATFVYDPLDRLTDTVFADIISTDRRGNFVEAIQLVRRNKNNTLPFRELEAASELEAVLGTRTRFVDVGSR